MAIYHRATVTPTKAELIADWLPTRPWGPSSDTPIEVIGSYRFDDPDGRVGLETMIVTAGDTLLQVPLTYREAPLDEAADALITEMHHSALGPRWVYDGLHDPLFVVMLASVALTGQGEAVGMGVYEERWWVVPSDVRISGGGWTTERVAIDGFDCGPDDGDEVTLGNERFDLTFFRRPQVGAPPAVGLTATWTGQDDAVVLAQISERSA